MFDLSSRVVSYSEEENKLSVIYSNGTVCEYSPVNVDCYTDTIKADCLDKALKKIIHTPHVVGVRKAKGEGY